MTRPHGRSRGTPGRDGPANKVPSVGGQEEEEELAPTAARRGLPPPLELASATPPTRQREPAGASTRQGAAAAGSHDAGAARGRGRARAEATRVSRTSSPLGATGRNPAPKRCTVPRRPCCASSRQRPDSQGAGGQSRGPQRSRSPGAKRLKARDAAPSPADKRPAPRACCDSTVRLANVGVAPAAHRRLAGPAPGSARSCRG